MGKQIVIKTGYSRLALPDGRAYDGGQTAVLSDANVARLSDAVLAKVTVGATVPDPVVPSTGTGGLDEAAVGEIVDQKIGEIQTLPDGGDNGQVLTKISAAPGDATWTIPTTATAAIVRAWTASPLLYAYAFENGLSQTGWDSGGGGTPTLTQASDVPAGKPAYSYFEKMDYPFGQSFMRLQMALVTALTGKTITRIKCWVRVESSNGGAAKFAIQQGSGGVERYSVNIAASGASPGWVQVDVPWTAIADMFFVAQANTRVYIAGLEVYGTAEPYALNDIVRYNGQFWRSLQANNPYVPGVQGWTAIS